METEEEKIEHKITIKDINENDLENWGYAVSRFIEILKGEYDLEEAREDLLSIVNSKKWGRGDEE